MRIELLFTTAMMSSNRSTRIGVDLTALLLL